MKSSMDWRKVWEQRSMAADSDFQVDRGRPPHDDEIEKLAEQQLIDFIDPKASETILDAGCGTGMNILRLHSRAAKLVGMDYSSGSLERCKKNIREHAITNVELFVASIAQIPLSDRSVNKVLCLSVLQYLDDGEVRCALREFIRVLMPGGVVVLHVKNLSSLYWLTLWPAKKLRGYIRSPRLMEYVRRFGWYVDQLKAVGCAIVGYDSFNLLTIDMLPSRLVAAVRGFEIKHHEGLVFCNRFVRRHGAELLIKASTPA